MTAMPFDLQKFDGFRAHGSHACAAMHPDALDTDGGAILNDGAGHGRRGHQQNAVNGRRDVEQAGETRPSVDFANFRIHGDGIIATFEELAKDGA